MVGSTADERRDLEVEELSSEVSEESGRNFSNKTDHEGAEASAKRLACANCLGLTSVTFATPLPRSILPLLCSSICLNFMNTDSKQAFVPSVRREGNIIDLVLLPRYLYGILALKTRDPSTDSAPEHAPTLNHPAISTDFDNGRIRNLIPFVRAFKRP